MKESFVCRLLCACNLAFAVEADGPVPLRQPYGPSIGFTDTPVGLIGGPDDINACLVGTIDEGVLLAFRGTLKPDDPNHARMIVDWLNDMDAVPVSRNDIPGMVHEGFWNGLASLWERIVAEVSQRLPQGSGKSLIITGYSKGGAMANIAAVRFSLQDIASTVCTFAAAHPGNEMFATAYDANSSITDSIRYEYRDDLVPHLPPGLAFHRALHGHSLLARLGRAIDYAPVGTLRFIDWNGVVEDDSAALERKRFARLERLLLELKFATVVDDHWIDCGFGYMSSICPTAVCP